jgi:hypothetical protein
MSIVLSTLSLVISGPDITLLCVVWQKALSDTRPDENFFQQVKIVAIIEFE